MNPDEQRTNDEAVSLSYWLAKQLGEHVDDQVGETLTDTVKRLLKLQATVKRVEADMPRLIVDAIADRMKP